MARMRGGEAVVHSLAAQGVDTVFDLISVHMMALYDARDRVRFVGGAARAGGGLHGDGYARATGRPGVALTSSGPGAATTMGAMGEAWACSSPVLQVTSNVKAALIDSGRGALHEPRHQLEMLRSVMGWTAQCRTVDEVPRAVFEAFERCKTQRPRPIAVEVATDALHADGEAEVLPARDYAKTQGEPKGVEEAARLLASARRPMLWAGGGVLSTGGWDELRSCLRRRW
ncbi:MAG: hypothetical protein EXR48_03250 [Dehalococcoidia bacterium]|nr:hypothetical protein [Dehalococcoidia bacterium]